MGKQPRKSTQEKLQILEESKHLGLVATARKHAISYQTLKNWQDKVSVWGYDGLKTGEGLMTPELKHLQLENQGLKEMVAEKELELKIKEELLKKTTLRK